MAHGWEGELVRLVPLEKARHLDNALKWFNDPEVTQWTETGDWPVTRRFEEEFFDAVNDAERRQAVFAVETLDGEHVGFSGLHGIEWQHGFALTGSIIGGRDLWGRGLGGDAARVRTRYAFDCLGLRTLQAHVMVDNEPSLRMLQALGYREVGRVPHRYWKRGAYRDQVILVLQRANR